MRTRPQSLEVHTHGTEAFFRWLSPLRHVFCHPHCYMLSIWEHHISSEQLHERLGLDSIEYYIARRQLRWLGHVLRMGPERLPRRMLSAWVAHKRPAGAPQFTYGRCVSAGHKLPARSVW